MPLATWAQEKTALNTAKLDSLLTVLEEKNKLMGSVAVFQGEKMTYSRAIGAASIKDGQQTKANTGTRYRVGSVTKTFTATMIMQLVEQKKLTLQTPLAQFFPQFDNAKTITVEHLLRHRSGLTSFTTDPAFGQFMRTEKTEPQLLEAMARMKSSFLPGEKYEYSNTNYVLLGLIVEKVTKQPYAQVLQKNIVEKLKLKNTFYGGKINAAKNEASSFMFLNNSWFELPETHMSVPHGAGALVSTPQDLGIFLRGLLQGKLVSKATVEQMKTLKDNYGLGLLTIPFGKLSSYGHGGIIDGFTSMLTYFPEQDVTIATTFNGANTNGNDVLIGLFSVVFNAPYKIPTFEAPKNLKLDLALYEGMFTSPTFPLKISMKKEGDQLMGQATGQSALMLEARSETQFVFEGAGITIEFSKSGKSNAYDQFTLKQGAGKFDFVKE